MSIRMYSLLVALLYSLCFRFPDPPEGLAGSVLLMFILIGVREFLRREEVPTSVFDSVLSVLCILFSLSVMVSTDWMILTLCLLSYGILLSFLLVMLTLRVSATIVCAHCVECYLLCCQALLARSYQIALNILRVTGIASSFPLPVRFLIAFTLPVTLVRLLGTSTRGSIILNTIVVALLLYTLLTSRARLLLYPSTKDTEGSLLHGVFSWIIIAGIVLLMRDGERVAYALQQTSLLWIVLPLSGIALLLAAYGDGYEYVPQGQGFLCLPGFLLLGYCVAILVTTFGLTHGLMLSFMVILGCLTTLVSLCLFPGKQTLNSLLILLPFCTLALFGVTTLDEQIIAKYPPVRRIQQTMVPDYDYLLRHNYDMSSAWSDIYLAISNEELSSPSVETLCQHGEATLKHHHELLVQRVQKQRSRFQRAAHYHHTEQFVAQWIQGNQRLLGNAYQQLRKQCANNVLEVL